MSITFGSGISIGKIVSGVPLPSPTVSTATVLSTSSSLVTFVPVSNACFPPIQSHTIIASPGCIRTVVSANTTSGIINGLSQGQTYTFTVVANNAFEVSLPSNASNSVTQIVVPGAPTSVSASLSGLSGAIISFTPPSNNGGSAITSYIVTSSPGNKTASGSTSPISISGLTQATAYSFSVKAANAVGPGSASTASNTITTPAVGSQSYTSPGTYSWVAPATVNYVSVVAVGGGGSAWCQFGGDSYFVSTSVVKGGGGKNNYRASCSYPQNGGGTFTGDGGGCGGGAGFSGAGGGAGGYTG